MTELNLTTSVRRKRSYEDRTGMTSRAARIVAKALADKGPALIENEFGEDVRAWRSQDLLRFTNDDIRKWLIGLRVTDAIEANFYVPPSAFKYAVTKGWLRKDEKGPFYWVTLRAAVDLNLPKPKASGVTCEFVA